MATRVAVLGAEGGAEGVDLAHREAVGLDVELSRDGQVSFAAKEVLAKVHTALLCTRQVGHVQGRDAEHLSGAFAVIGGDDGGVNPVEAALMEEAVDSLSQGVAHAGHGTNEVGAGTQVGKLAQVLH